MTTEEALENYRYLTSRIFSSKNRKCRGQDGTFKASTLVAEMRKIIAARLAKADEFMIDDSVIESVTGKV